jgi:DNA-binding CsgD family transcriptional regulator
MGTPTGRRRRPVILDAHWRERGTAERRPDGMGCAGSEYGSRTGVWTQAVDIYSRGDAVAIRAMSMCQSAELRDGAISEQPAPPADGGTFVRSPIVDRITLRPFEGAGMSASASQVIGRSKEFDSLRQFLDAVVEGPAAFLIEGEAGIGKTALWKQAVDLALQRSYRVLACRPADSETRLSFSALDDLLVGVLDEALPALPEPRRRALEVALLRAAGTGPPPDQRAVSCAVLDVLRLLATDSPVILAIDDAQWLDGPSAGVIEFAVRRFATRPIGILVSVRAETQRGVVPLGVDRGLPEDRLDRLQLGPLSLATIHQLVRLRLGATLPRHTLVRLYDASGGNPFFALEMARALVRRGVPVPPDQPLPVPATLRGLVLDRLGHLSGRSRRALLCAAALSHPTVGLVRAAGGDTVATAALDEARQAGIIDAQGERIRFTHPLLAAVLYSEASSGQLRRLHRRLAGVVADLEERARHLALGADGSDARIAAVVDEAARQAGARGAPDAAASLSEQAGRLTPVGETGEIRRRTVEAADHHFRAGHMGQARDLLEELVDALPPGADRAAALLRLGVIHYHQDSWPMAERLLHQALLEGGRDPALRAEAERELAFSRHVAGDTRGAAQHARAAVEAAELTGDSFLVADSLSRMAAFDFYLGEGLHAGLMERAAALAASAGAAPAERGPMLDVGVIWGAMLKWSDDFGAARVKLGGRCRRAAEIGDDSSLPFVLYQLSELECWAGDWDRARQYAEEACRVALESEQVAVLPAALYARALVDTHLGRIESARADAEEALALAARTRNVPVALEARSVLGLIELSQGNFERTHAHLGPVAEAMAAMEVAEPGVVRFWANEIEALIGLGELDKATAGVAQLEERGRSLDRPWALATGARCRGLLEAARGDLGAADRALERALKEHERLPMPFEFGRTLLVQGTIRRRARQKRAARDSLERAVEIFERLGAPLWADKARAELRRIGLRPPAPSGLTPSEERVAELVAAGHTNREVADALFISVKTVDSNLSRIYRKLGVRSRTELARKLPAEGGPAPTS